MSNKKVLKRAMCLLLAALTIVLTKMSPVMAQEHDECFVGEEYGVFAGDIWGGDYSDAKWFYMYVRTPVAVPQMSLYWDMMYAGSGKRISRTTLFWIHDTSFLFEDLDLYHWNNVESDNPRDHFIGTPVLLYATGDVITKQAYAIYMSAVR